MPANEFAIACVNAANAVTAALSDVALSVAKNLGHHANSFNQRLHKIFSLNLLINKIL
jgi:hypothetical protein